MEHEQGNFPETEKTIRSFKYSTWSLILTAIISAVIWIVISAFTGGPAAFVILGAILCGLVVFVVGYSIRRVAIHH